MTICLTHPGYEIDVLVVADRSTFFKVWLGQLDYDKVLDTRDLTVTGAPRLTRAFPAWFAWSVAAPVVRAFRAGRSEVE